MSVLDIVLEAERLIKERLNDLPKIGGKEVGLDPRCGKFWIDVENREIIVNEVFVGTLDYFGGFQYITDTNDRTICGKYTIYGGYNERVEDAVDHYEEHYEGKE